MTLGVVVVNKVPPHPMNVEGDFFVEDGCCVACLVPMENTADMLKYDDSVGHCYVVRQPVGRDETMRMAEAISLSEVFCIHYAGYDTTVLSTLRKLGRLSQHNERGAASVIKDSAIFNTFAIRIANVKQKSLVVVMDKVRPNPTMVRTRCARRTFSR